jgi:hypothetical protein
MAQRVRPSQPPFYPVTHPALVRSKAPTAGTTTTSGSLYIDTSAASSIMMINNSNEQQHFMSYNSTMNHHLQQEQQQRPASSGLIRITLRKPMGIVFEPMPQQPGSKGTGVRICDLPRTGAAALSGKLELGDELLSINGVTMSRLTFDEIMDFIIAADPEGLHLLFRRQRKTNASAAATSSAAAHPASSTTPTHRQQHQTTSTVKWAKQESEVYDGNHLKSSTSGRSTKSKDHPQQRHIEPNRSKSSSREDEESYNDDDETNTYQSEEPSIHEYQKKKHSKKKDRSSSHAVEKPSSRTYTSSSNKGVSTSSSRNKQQSKQTSSKHKIKKKNDEMGFLDMLIDSFCQVTNGGKLAGRKDDDSMYTEDDYSEEGTYQTNDDPSLVSEDYRAPSNKKKKSVTAEKKRRSRETTSSSKHQQRGRSSRRMEEESVDEEQTLDEEEEEEEETVDEGGTVEDDCTLETMDTNERAVQRKAGRATSVEDGTSEYSEDPDASIGWAPLKGNESKSSKGSNSKDHGSIEKKPASRDPLPLNTHKKKQPILQYEPTLENRQSTSFDANIQLPFRELEYNYDADEGDVSVLTNNMSQYGSHISPQALVYVHSYVPEPGKTLQECIESNPERFYRHAVKEILSHNEPEKVRLLDKLLAKYQGREEHLIQKLTLRYKATKQQQHADEQQNETAKQWGKTATIPEDGESTQQSPMEIETNEKEESRTKQGSNSMNYESLGSFGTMEDAKSPMSFSSSIQEQEKSPIKEDTPPRLKPQATAKGVPKVPKEKFDSPPPAPPARKLPPELVLPSSFSSEEIDNTQDARNAGVGKSTTAIPKSLPQDSFHQQVPSPPRMDVPKENTTTTTPMDTFHMEDEFSADEGESEYTSEDYSDSQIDGTSPAVIAQVSELLNFVYGKTSVPGQIDRVSTIMRAYEGRENVLLELLETKALIKANQMNEHPPAGLISSTNIGSQESHDEAYDDYDDHQDDISSVSGDNSTKFNVKVPLASERVSPIVSPITPSVTNTVSFKSSMCSLFLSHLYESC